MRKEYSDFVVGDSVKAYISGADSLWGEMKAVSVPGHIPEFICQSVCLIELLGKHACLCLPTSFVVYFRKHIIRFNNLCQTALMMLHEVPSRAITTRSFLERIISCARHWWEEQDIQVSVCKLEISGLQDQLLLTQTPSTPRLHHISVVFKLNLLSVRVRIHNCLERKWQSQQRSLLQGRLVWGLKSGSELLSLIDWQSIIPCPNYEIWGCQPMLAKEIYS